MTEAARHRPASTADGAHGLRIYLLGGFRAMVDGHAIAAGAWHLRRARTLVKLLALAPQHQMHREHIVDLLWPDLEPEAASNNLHQVLHVARRALAPDAPGASGILQLRDELLTLCPRPSPWIDVEAFEAALADARHGEDPATYQAAVDLYTGDLLPEDRYEDWAAARREMLRQQYLDLLCDLARLHEARHEPLAASAALRRVLAADPAHEGAHSGLMRLYALTGQRQQAVRQFGLLQEAVRHELDAEPLASSRRLYADILAGHYPPDGAAIGQGEAAPPAHDVAPRPIRANLPTLISSFVGRAHELAEVTGLLGRTRLLTLTGVGGCGKTRLAIQAGAAVLQAFPDGVWLVELASIGDRTLVPQAVMVALGVLEQPGCSLVETLTHYLKRKRLLLILDNCEHLIMPCAGLAESLVRDCPHLHILATSREPLRVPGEVVWRVSSLSLPDPRHLPALDQLQTYEAIQLFVDRAQAILPSFEATERTAPTIAQVCYRLDGLPLAIELAAARMTALSVDQIAARLDDCFRLLTGGSRTVLGRQQTLKATVDWSYDLLSEPEQVFFRRLAVFARGFSLDAADVVGAGDGLDGLDLVTGLIDKSLLVVEAHGREPRYRLLEPIRQYAQHRLAASEESTAVHGRHCAWYLDLATRARDELWTVRHTAALVLLEREHDNLRAALDWCVDGEGGASIGLRLVDVLWQFWLLRGHLAEGRRWLDRMLERVPARAAPRAATLLHLYALANRLGDTPLAVAAAEESLAIYREVDDTRGCVHAGYSLGIRAWLNGDYPRARALFEESLAHAHAAGLSAHAALATHALGIQAWAQGLYGRARLLMDESLALLRQGTEQRNLASVFLNLGWFDTARHDDEPAAVLTEETVILLREVATSTAVGYILANLGNLARVEGDYERAHTYLDQSVAQFQHSGDRAGLAQALGQLGNLARVEGAYERASALLAESLALRQDMGERRGIGRTLGNQGMLALARGDDAGARALYEDSLTLFREMGDRPGIAGTLELMGHLALSSGDDARARALYEESCVIYTEITGNGPTLAFSLLHRGAAARRQGDAAAHALFAASLALFQRMDDQRNTTRLLRILANLTDAETAPLSHP